MKVLGEASRVGGGEAGKQHFATQDIADNRPDARAA